MRAIKFTRAAMHSIPATCLALSLIAAGPGQAHDGHSHGTGGHVMTVTPVVDIRCTPGPRDAATWDRPTRAFTNSLRAAGFDRAEARRIAAVVCGDTGAAGDPRAMHRVLRSVLNAHIEAGQ